MSMKDQATPRTIDLIRTALESVTQAQYEGDHRRRQEPEPSIGSPWDRPDLPYEVHAALSRAEEALRLALDLAHTSYTKEVTA